MNLTDLANVRSGFGTKMSELLTIISGNHTTQQRSDALDSATAECFTLCKTAKAVRVANPTSLRTEEFYSRPDLPLCSLMDGFHVNLGGKHMYEMFCRQPVIRDPACTNPPYQPSYPEGPLVLMFPAGEDVHTYLYDFQGTVEYSDGTVETYSERTDLEYMTLPDEGDGYCTLRLRGVLGNRSQHDYHGRSYEQDHIIDVWQWGTECVIEDYNEFFVIADLPCFGVSATDSPWFGVHDHGTYGTTPGEMFSLCPYFTNDISHWDMTNVESMFYFMSGTGSQAGGYTHDLSHWDMSHLSKNQYASFASVDDYAPELWPDFEGFSLGSGGTHNDATWGVTDSSLVAVMDQSEFIHIDKLYDKLGVPWNINGNHNAYNYTTIKWIKAVFDGQEVIFPNHGISEATARWMDIYDAGMLYGDGTDGATRLASQNPVTQDKTITVAGIEYSITLPRGLASPTASVEDFYTTGDSDLVNSEWNHMCKLIEAHAKPSYAGFSPQWAPVQEHYASNPEWMIVRQYSNNIDAVRNQSYSGLSAGGWWYPVLRRITP